MDSNTIKIQIADRERKIANIRKEISDLEDRLCEALLNECRFKVGQKIKTKKGEVGIFSGFDYKYRRPEPIVHKIKKDGTKSLNKIWVYSEDDLEAL